ncbi:MAG: hypothetical protein IPN90_10450 [Elusimicrobia bacterium]|nr:hypothetical protein [Elusimicrobiota bacterium]
MLPIKNKLTTLVLVLSLSGGVGRKAFSAPAELPTQKTTVFSQLGLALPAVGDMGDIADTGLFFGAQVMQEVEPNASFGFGVSYYSFGKASEDQVDTSVSVLSTMMMTHHTLGARGSTSPFVKTGLGFARTQVNINSGTTTGSAPVEQGTNQEDISPTLLLGLGFDMKVSQGALLGMSLDYQHFFFRVGDVNGGGSFNVVAHVRM